MALGNTDREFGEKLKSAFGSRTAEPVPDRILALAEALDRTLVQAQAAARRGVVKDQLSQ